jgi:23S rRNA (adenine2503-C2)-methyltransferase
MLPSLIGFDLNNFKEMLSAIHAPSFRAKQLYHWLYHHGVRHFDEMKNIPKDLKDLLLKSHTFNRPSISSIQRSRDGTQKWLLRFDDGNEVESVFIPEAHRGTLCVSSQVGCTLTCKFCHTGTQKLVRNLTAGEIVAQVMVARDVFGEWPTPQEKTHLTNIVMMGMGEPLFNYEHVKKALLLLMDQEGLGFSKYKITLSTSGVLPFFEPCATELGVNLAISLHATTDELRDHLVPINKKYPLKDLINACERYATLTNGRRMTFEYVMLNEVNDSVEDAHRLVGLMRGLPVKVNLIPFNPWPGSGYVRSTDKRIKAFSAIIEKAGYNSPVRRPRGEDVLAACGQLKSQSERVFKSRQGEAQKACHAP